MMHELLGNRGAVRSADGHSGGGVPKETVRASDIAFGNLQRIVAENEAKRNGPSSPGISERSELGPQSIGFGEVRKGLVGIIEGLRGLPGFTSMRKFLISKRSSFTIDDAAGETVIDPKDQGMFIDTPLGSDRSAWAYMRAARIINFPYGTVTDQDFFDTAVVRIYQSDQHGGMSGFRPRDASDGEALAYRELLEAELREVAPAVSDK